MPNIYQPIEGLIEEVITESPTIKTFVVRPQGRFEFKTGQFIELSLPGIGEAPFTPSSDPNIKDRFDVTIMNAGKITSMLHNSSSNTIVGIRGPYGLGYPLDTFKGKDILIVGGGVGLAPLRSLLLALFGRMSDFGKIIMRYGARSPGDIIYKSLIPQWQQKANFDMEITVDRGDDTWKGKVGLVTTLLKGLPINMETAVSIVCGPPIMMKFATLKLLEIGFKPKDIYLSMEKNMSCGLGKCGHCRIGKYYICKDGPVFTYEQLKDLLDIWD